MRIVRISSVGIAFLLIGILTQIGAAAELSVGPGQRFARPEDAVAAAAAGDVILVRPSDAAEGYPKTALLIRTSHLTIRAAGDGKRVRLSGTGFDYSGNGRVPRAIIQFDPSASGCLLEGFDLAGAHNESFNGAGVRINQASEITIRDCEIHDNDMGIMSNGKLEAKSGDNQLIESCRIHHNGNTKEPGQNHNLYLGGTAVTLRGCEVFASLTGHNVKSRAHLTHIEGCYIHDAMAREVDLVDQTGNTDVPDSNAVVAGCILVKGDLGPESNHAVIHFGQDVKQGRVGRLWLVNNTIVTKFISPVIQLSSPKTAAVVFNNIVWDAGSGQSHQVLAAPSNGADVKNVTGGHNWLANGFRELGAVQLDAATTWFGDRGAVLPFVDAAKGDFHLTKADDVFIGRGMAWKTIDRLGDDVHLLEFSPPTGSVKRSDAESPALGAMEMHR